MTRSDAEAVLWALATTLEWEFSPVGRTEQHTALSHREIEKANYRFTLSTAVWRNLGRDASGTTFRWLLHVERFSPSWLWCFPCRTVGEGKAICEHLASSGEAGEVERRDGLRYPLVWEAGPDGREKSLVAIICKRHPHAVYGHDTVRYVVVGEKGWLTRCFTAAYLVPEYVKSSSFYVNARLLRPCSRPPLRYRTEAEAKAACDRHHWTGRWE